MYDILPETGGDVIAIRVTGKLTESDYGGIGDLMKERVAAHGPFRLLIEMQRFAGWESLGAMWEDLKLYIRHNQDIERMAMVGEEGWQDWMTQIASPFMHGAVHYFDSGERDAAFEWLRKV